ncbi:MAG: hypothetical protein PHX08_15170 [Lachnospiraceae bacterium]|nr:hypothetical protein [Lachnospiraceae bacterium]
MEQQREEIVILISVGDVTHNDMRGTIRCFNQPYEALMEDMEDLILKIEECIELVQQNQIYAISPVVQNYYIYSGENDCLVKYLFLVRFRNYADKCRGGKLHCVKDKCNWTFKNMLELLKLMTDSMNLFNEPLYSGSFSIKNSHK